MGNRPSTKSTKESHSPSLSSYPLPIASLPRVSPWWPFIHPWWNLNWLGLVRVLCRLLRHNCCELMSHPEVNISQLFLSAALTSSLPPLPQCPLRLDSRGGCYRWVVHSWAHIVAWAHLLPIAKTASLSKVESSSNLKGINKYLESSLTTWPCNKLTAVPYCPHTIPAIPISVAL